MSFKKVLAILLAAYMIVPMTACGKDTDPSTDGIATTVQQADVTDGNGEANPTGEGETTDTTGEQATISRSDIDGYAGGTVTLKKHGPQIRFVDKCQRRRL